jgi:hypothetical protein
VRKRNRLILSLAVGLLLCAVQASARDIFVSTSGSDANPGDAPGRALRTIAAASQKAAAGDVVQIMAGRYQEPIKPVKSGAAGKPIIYRSHGTSPAILTHDDVGGLAHAIDINGKSYIVVDGIDVDGVARRPNARVHHFATITNSSNVVIRRGRFRYAEGWHGIAVEGGAKVTIEDNEIDFVGIFDNGDATNSDIGDAVVIGKTNPGTQQVLVRRNRVRHAGHNLLALYGRNCVIETNDFNNSWRDVLGGDKGGRIASLMGSNNLFQLNYVTGAGASSDASTNTLMKVEGSQNVARNNVLTFGNGEGITTSTRMDQTTAKQLRIYGNTIYRIGGAAWRLETFAADLSMGDNVFLNNLVVDPRQNPASPNVGHDLVFKVALANAGPTARSLVLGNLISSAAAPPKAMLFGFEGLLDLSAAETLYPQFFDGNLAERSLFVKSNPAVFTDFALASGSPAIDRGRYLTTVVGTGRGQQVKVRDSRFFTNGYNLVPGDLVQLQGSTQRARVTQVDHSTGTLRVDRALDFADGRGIALAYERSGPDVGAREFGLPPKLSPPAQVRAQ